MLFWKFNVIKKDKSPGKPELKSYVDLVDVVKVYVVKVYVVLVYVVVNLARMHIPCGLHHQVPEVLLPVKL